MIADLITDYSVLQPDVQPDREVIVHRDGEIDRLTSVLAPLTHDVAPGGAFLYGPPGSGKTCTTHCVLEDLADEADVEIVFIDCLSSHARRSALKRVLEELGAASELEHRLVATDDLAALVCEAIDGVLWPALNFMSPVQIDRTAILFTSHAESATTQRTVFDF